MSATTRTATEKVDRSHERSLDGLRFIAFVAVFALHSGLAFGPWPAWLYSLGASGVWAFFVLSGFLIGGILLREKDDVGISLKEKLRVFYVRRSLRIFPLYYAVMIITTLLSHFGFPRFHYGWTDPWYWVYLANIAIYNHHESPGPQSHLWSLSVEEQFYLVAPLCLLLVSTRKLSWAFVAIWIGCAATRLHTGVLAPNPFAHVLPSMELDCLTLGVAAAILQKEGSFLGVSGRTFGIAAILFAICAIPTNLYIWSPNQIVAGISNITGQWLFSAAVAGLILALWNGRGGPVRSILAWQPIAYLGKISYGLYVIHLFCLDAMLFNVPALQHRNVEACAIAFALTVVISMLSWHLFEKPINDLKRFFPYRKVTASTLAYSAGDKVPAEGETVDAEVIR